MQGAGGTFGLVQADAHQRDRQRDNEREPARGGRFVLLKVESHRKRMTYFERMSVCLRAVGVSSTFRQPDTTLVSAVSLTHTGISSLSVR